MTQPPGAATAAPPSWLPILALVLLALVASISGINNQYAQDDLPIIFTNPAVHDLLHGFRVFVQAYWPKPFAPDLYRPLALLSFAVQWAVGAGSPLIFRIVSYLLYAATAVAVFRVARQALPFAAAFGAAALFAVHPVHVEAVAVAVNQGELWVTLLSCAAVYRYLQIRRRGDVIKARDALGIGLLYLIACLFKETGIILPGLLAGSELLLVGGTESLSTRVRRIRPFFLFLALLAVSFLALRSTILGGDVVGTSIAEVFAKQGVGGRLLIMLTVVPYWIRLLLWPAHLQGDYSPAEIVAQTGWVADDTLGLLIVAGLVTACVLAWRRAPAIAFGLVWFAVAIFPVHNVLVPTGIVLAERTLLLPSVGAMIALGGLGALLLERGRPGERFGLAAITGLLLVLGVYRSTTRHPVWFDQITYWHQTANRDAPASYRAHHAMAQLLLLAKLDGQAEKEFRLAIALAPPGVSSGYVDYANRLRLRGFCYPAVPLYRKALEITPTYLAARASLTSCLIDQGKYDEAQREIRIGLASGEELPTWRWLRKTTDSAITVHAPPGSVPLSAPNDSTSWFKIGTTH